MPELGRKYTCYSCHTKFYDLGKPVPLCPKCGADQRDADDTPVYTPARRGRVAAAEPEPVEDEEFTPAAEPAEEGAEEEDFTPDAREEEADDDEDEEEY